MGCFIALLDELRSSNSAERVQAKGGCNVMLTEELLIKRMDVEWDGWRE